MELRNSSSCQFFGLAERSAGIRACPLLAWVDYLGELWRHLVGGITELPPYFGLTSNMFQMGVTALVL